MNKIGNSFRGIIVGFLMILIGVVLLWWNEGNNVKNLKTTAELEEKYIDVKSNSVNSKNEGKLVATYGKLINDNELTDTTFGVTIKTPLMTRIVEMYQWEEDTETDKNGKTKYIYKKTWSEEVINSSEFHDTSHENPTEKLYENEIYASDDVKVGVFSLSDNQINKLSTKGSYTNFDAEKIKSLNLTAFNKYITNSNDLQKPNIGDIRISFNYNNSNEISVLAVQTRESFTSFKSKAGKTINRIMDGKYTGKEIIEKIKSENNFLKWILRVVGTLLCIIGVGAILSPISTITGFIPILGSVVGAAVGLVSIALGSALSLIVIAIAWIRFRPVLGISLLAIAVMLIILLTVRGKKTKEKNNSPQQISE